ncbi:amidohydrolase family protein [Microbacterium luticocti]|uniref:amidohydrolase family protein n=1 Tax=Microbacterium luticocti TaxID=451764 RepID=UPI0004268E85|nr:amidohydrolase family protein [Microbacterium luticocti]
MTLIDAHVHVWDTAVLDYPWLTDATGPGPRFLPADIDRADGQSTRMVFVEADALAGQALAEARWVAGLDWPERAGIVAHADLRAADLSAALDALQAVPQVVGVRHLLQGEDAAAWRPDVFAAGLGELGRRGLVFDACVRAGQLDALAQLLDRAPGTATVLDHLGKPPVDAGIDSAPGRAWRAGIDRVAALPHVWVKLSGLAAEASDAASFDRHADGFIAAAIDAFGISRCMIGSDWPVSARTGAGMTLADWVDRVRRVSGTSGAQWDELAERNAARFYGLD